MHVTRPFRLRAFPYVGYHRYLLTLCTADRRPAFVDARVVGTLLKQLRQSSMRDGMAVVAYCFMPDHLHILVEGTRADAELRGFVARFKQRSGYWHHKCTGQDLWQSSYHDYVLRSGDATADVVRYVLANPVRAGLSQQIGDYPFAGAEGFDIGAMTWDAATGWQG